MRLLFLSAQLPGHLDWGGYLATAAELRGRGHEVLWASGNAVRSRVEQEDVAFHMLAETGWRWPPPAPLPPPSDAADPAWQLQRALRALDQWLDEERVAAAAEELARLAHHFAPDLVVTEMFVAAAGIVAELAGVPLVVAGWPAVQPAGDSRSGPAQAARGRLERLLRRFDVTGKHWTSSGPPTLQSQRLHVTYWSPAWYRGMALLPQTQHAGGRAPAARPAPDALPGAQERPWVVVTLGTTFNDDPNFFLGAANAADRLGCLPIVVLGPTPDSNASAPWLAQLPAGTAVCSTIHFAEVLPYTTAAIHHGGAGTTHALVTWGVPQVVVPHAADQMHQAQGVVRSGAGIYLPPRQATVDALTAALAAMLPDLAPYRSRALALQAEFAALGGPSHAADLIAAVCTS